MDRQAVSYRFLMLFLALLVSLGVAFCAIAPTASAESYDPGYETVKIKVQYGQTEARSMLDMINDFRTGSDAWCWNENNEKELRGGLSPLVYDYELEKTAQLRAAEIALCFSHERPFDGTSYVFDLNSTICAENIAVGSTTARSAFVMWQETNEGYAGQGHRRNMLSANAKTVAIGHVVYNGVHYWVQLFGESQNGPRQTTAADSVKTVNVAVSPALVTNRMLEYPKPVGLFVTLGESVAPKAVTCAIEVDGSWPANTWLPIEAEVNWQSANNAICVVQAGKVVGKKVGTTKVTAVANLAGEDVSAEVPTTVGPISLANATVSKIEPLVYNGKQRKPQPVVKLNGKTLTKGTDYYLKYTKNINAGKATVTAVGKGNYGGQAKATFTIKKAANPMKVKTYKPSVKYSKSKKRVVAADKAIKVTHAQGTVVYKRVKNDSDAKLSINKAGKITVKKGTAKGEHKIKVQVVAKGNKNYKSVKKTVVVRVTVKK